MKEKNGLLEPFVFDPANGFNDTAAFPDPTNEAEVREQLFRLHKQTRDYINDNLLVGLLYKQDLLYAGANIKIYTKNGKTYIAATGGGEGGGVSQEYVDQMDALTLELAKIYVDENENGFVRVTDIVDRLNSTDKNKPLSANQGYILNNKMRILSAAAMLTLPTDGWTLVEGSTKRYQDFVYEGMLESYIAEIIPNVPETLTDDEEEAYFEEYNKIDEKSKTKDGYIRIYLSEELTTSIEVIIKGVGVIAEEKDHYEGDYVVDPKETDVELYTNDLILDDNIKVNAIEYKETPNIKGGLTVDIGKEEEE